MSDREDFFREDLGVLEAAGDGRLHFLERDGRGGRGGRRGEHGHELALLLLELREEVLLVDGALLLDLSDEVQGDQQVERRAASRALRQQSLHHVVKVLLRQRQKPRKQRNNLHEGKAIDDRREQQHVLREKRKLPRHKKP